MLIVEKRRIASSSPLECRLPIVVGLQYKVTGGTFPQSDLNWSFIVKRKTDVIIYIFILEVFNVQKILIKKF